MMKTRKGASLVSSLVAIAAVAAAGTAGVMTLTGNGVCTLMCGPSDVDATASGVAVLPVADGRSGDSCCPLTAAAAESACGDKAGAKAGDRAGDKADARVIAASDDASACTEAKASCDSPEVRAIAAGDASSSCSKPCGEGEARVIAAAAGAEEACDKPCGEGVMKVASAEGSCTYAKAACGEAVQPVVAMMMPVASKRDAAAGECNVMRFRTQVASFFAMHDAAAENVSASCAEVCGEPCSESKAACADVCGTPCGDGEAKSVTVAEGASCSKPCDAKGVRSASPIAAHMVSGGVVLPAMFNSADRVDVSALKAAKASCGAAKDACSTPCDGAKMIGAGYEKGDRGDTSECGEKKACDKAEPVAFAG